MADIVFYGQFIESKVGKNGLAVTVDIERITRSDGTRTAHVTGASATEVTRRGLYYYRLTGSDLITYDYVATFITTDTGVDQKEIAALWTLFSLQVWANPERTLTQSAAQVAAAATGPTLTVYSHSTWTINLTGMGDISDRSNLYLTVKAKPDDDADSAAILQVDEDNGLLYIGGEKAGDKTKATLTVTDENVGNATISVHASVTGLKAQSKLSYDVRKVTEAGVAIPIVEGREKWHILAAVTRAIA